MPMKYHQRKEGEKCVMMGKRGFSHYSATEMTANMSFALAMCTCPHQGSTVCMGCLLHLGCKVDGAWSPQTGDNPDLSEVVVSSLLLLLLALSSLIVKDNRSALGFLPFASPSLYWEPHPWGRKWACPLSFLHFPSGLMLLLAQCWPVKEAASWWGLQVKGTQGRAGYRSVSSGANATPDPWWALRNYLLNKWIHSVDFKSSTQKGFQVGFEHWLAPQVNAVCVLCTAVLIWIDVFVVFVHKLKLNKQHSL